jgi:hypothetical protein
VTTSVRVARRRALPPVHVDPATAALLQAGKLEQACPDCGGPRDRRAVLCQSCRHIDNRTFTTERIQARLAARTVRLGTAVLIARALGWDLQLVARTVVR